MRQDSLPSAGRSANLADTRDRSSPDWPGLDLEQVFEALDGAGIGFWCWTPSVREMRWSATARRLFGYPAGSSASYFDSLFTEDRGWVADTFASLIDEPAATRTLCHRIRRADGSQRWLEVAVHHRPAGPLGPRLIGLLRDITEEQQQEEEQRQHRQRQELANEAARVGIWDCALPDNRIIANARAAALHGLPEAEFSGHLADIFVHVPEQERKRLTRIYLDLIAGTDNSYWVDYPVWLAGGRVRYIECRALLFRDSVGQPQRMVGSCIDVTASRLHEQRLLASERKFAILFQGSPDPMTLTRPNGEFIEINPAFSETFGWTPAEVLGRSTLDIGFWVDPRNRRPLDNLPRNGHSLSGRQAAFRTKDGRTLVCMLSSRYLEVNDEPSLISTFRDVSDQLAAAEALRASEEKFAKAFHSSPDGICITERTTGTYIEVNEAFCRLSGFDMEELIGRSALDVAIWESPDERDRVLELLERNGQVRDMEIRARHRNGSLRIVQMSAEPIDLSGRDCLLMTSRDISELRQAEAQIQHLAFHDPLTNLPNRSLLNERLVQQIALLSRHGLHGALLFIDLDHFKHINDSLGHPVGDGVLQQVTARLQASVRTEDTVARLGGDEFVLLLSGLEGPSLRVAREVRRFAHDLRLRIAEPMQVGRHRLQITSSIGMALIPEHGNTPEELLKSADIALYRSKDAGRNTVQLFRRSMQAALSKRLQLEQDLRQALARGEFHLHYQPQVDSRDSRIVGAEALLRWHHAERGEQPPGQFIRVLEQSGLIRDVGAWVVEEAARATVELLRDGLVDADSFVLSVNISPSQFRQTDFAERIIGMLARTGLPSHVLKLEITEGIFIEHFDDTIAKMRRLRQAGICFAMDDFGTGYSSLSYLKRLPLDTLKIDQSFVRDATDNPNDAAIVRTIVALADNLGLGLIAEGVEIPDQLALLERLGCHRYQGYLFSRPLPLERFRTLLEERRQP